MQLIGAVDGLAAGEWEVQVFIYTVGYAIFGKPILVYVPLELLRIEPSEGGSLGGTLLTVFGFGLGPGLQKNDRSQKP